MCVDIAVVTVLLCFSTFMCGLCVVGLVIDPPESFGLVLYSRLNLKSLEFWNIWLKL